ncbi:MAG: sulfotransferase family protein [Gemmataceae bacterium]
MESPFQVPPFLHVLGGLVQRRQSFWLWLGRLESRLLAEEIAPLAVHMPIYVCGLARSGSTLLHEIVASHPHVATHRIKDYPMLFTPYWWRRASANARPSTPRQRVHQDGVMVTSESADALEEMLWMAFFPRCHDPSVSNLLGSEDRHPDFEEFYDRHIRKLLLAEGARRYAAKANYHVARLPYLTRLFPDARFVLPVRAPASHIASLRNQQRWFAQGQRKHPRALAYMQRSGHFEFGLDRRPMHLGAEEKVRRIQSAWAAGEEVRGLAMYWDMVYGYLARLLDGNASVRAASSIVRYEALRATPRETLRAVFEHCSLPDSEALVERHASTIRAPTSDERAFTAEERAIIHAETADTARLWGY